MNFRICLYDITNVTVSAIIISLDGRWRRILHEEFHVPEETCNT